MHKNPSAYIYSPRTSRSLFVPLVWGGAAWWGGRQEGRKAGREGGGVHSGGTYTRNRMQRGFRVGEILNVYSVRGWLVWWGGRKEGRGVSTTE